MDQKEKMTGYKPKYKRIAEDLNHRIQSGCFQETDRLPREYALMEEYQVSRQTIRSALEILDEEGMIERRRGSGSYILNRRRTKKNGKPCTVAVVTTDIDELAFHKILSDVEETLSRNNCMTLLFSTQNRVAGERNILEKVRKMDIDGMIVKGTKTALPNPNLDIYQELQEKHFPIVFINGCYPQLPDSISVSADDEEGGKRLVRYLAENGHTRIAGVFRSDDTQGIARYFGYMQGLIENRLVLDDSMVSWCYMDDIAAAWKTRLVKNTIADWRNKGCTAIICDNEEVTCHTIQCLNEMGIIIPKQMCVVSFENSQSTPITASITALSYGERNVGHVAAEKMLKLLSGECTVS